MKRVIILTFLIGILLSAPVSAHSGRTDANGGHNCYTGPCAGTYHYHNGGGASAPAPSYTPPPEPEPKPTYTPPSTSTKPKTTQPKSSSLSTSNASKDSDTDCFIATAAYGTPTAAQIDVLREFRDKSLVTNTFGATFVKTYYTYSPPIADFIAQNRVLKWYIREFHIDPLVGALNFTKSVWD